MSAYACEPGKSSEPAVGWNWALQAARHHEVWVLTRASNRNAIEAALVSEPVPNLHFVYHDLPPKLRFWKRGNRGVHLYYLLWQLSALRIVRQLHAEVRFDVGHHVTFVSQRFPSFLAWLDLPYVWGPVAGAERAPSSFYGTFARGARLKQRLRDLSNSLVRFDPLIRRTARRAHTIIAATPDTATALESSFGRPAQTSLAVGWSGTVADTQPVDGALKAVFVGRLVYWKGVHLALDALAVALRMREGITLTIVGEGPERARLEQQMHDLGIEDAVRFAGQVLVEQVPSLLSEHNAFVFPSFQDSGGFAVLEAMAARLPVVALASGGPALLVTPDTGVLVTPRNPRQTIDELAAALVRLHDDPDRRARLGAAGAGRLQDEFTWDRLGDHLTQTYEHCIEREAVVTREPLYAGVLDG